MTRFALLGRVLCLLFSSTQAASVWDRIPEYMSYIAWLGPFNLLIGDGLSVIANVTVGEWSPHETVTPIYSASKLASGAVFFNLDAEGILPLDSKVSEHLSWWTTSTEDARSNVTIRHLLDFTSGFHHHDCILEAQWSHEECAQKMYEESFHEQDHGSWNYNSAHLEIAVAVALKVTDRTDWNQLWYERVGNFSGLPAGHYWDQPSREHPEAAGGMTISSDNYSKFLASLQSSLSSKERPTQPLKIGPGIGYGHDWLERSDDEEIYKLVSWSGFAGGAFHSTGCAGWFPGIVPETPEQPGFWLQLARTGGYALSCIGTLEMFYAMPDLVPSLIEMVKEYKSDNASQPLEMVLADMTCQRDNEAKALCRCEDYSLETCLDACSSGTLSELACSDPFGETFKGEYMAVCMRCDDDGDGNDGSCSKPVSIPKRMADMHNARVCH